MKATLVAKLVTVLSVSIAWSAQAQTLTSFTTTYKGGSGTCGTTYNIQGKEPSSTLKYPVFIYLVGTSETYNNGSALAAVDELVGLDQVARVVRVVGYVASAEGFSGQPRVVNGASELLGKVFGEAGRHARSAVGVAELPLGAPVEIELTVELR